MRERRPSKNDNAQVMPRAWNRETLSLASGAFGRYDKSNYTLKNLSIKRLFILSLSVICSYLLAE